MNCRSKVALLRTGQAVNVKCCTGKRVGVNVTGLFPATRRTNFIHSSPSWPESRRVSQVFSGDV